MQTIIPRHTWVEMVGGKSSNFLRPFGVPKGRKFSPFSSCYFSKAHGDDDGELPDCFLGFWFHQVPSRFHTQSQPLGWTIKRREMSQHSFMHTQAGWLAVFGFWMELVDCNYRLGDLFFVENIIFCSLYASIFIFLPTILQKTASVVKFTLILMWDWSFSSLSSSNFCIIFLANPNETFNIDFLLSIHRETSWSIERDFSGEQQHPFDRNWKEQIW